MKQKLSELYRNNGHMLLCLYLPVYLAAFFWVESYVPSTSNYWVSYCALDDLIPFCEWFVLPYYSWYALLVGMGVYFMLREPQTFKRYMAYIMISFSFSILFFVIFPNGQNLRPAVMPNDSFCCRMVAAIYSADTNTNVLPSIHVAGGLAAYYAVRYSPRLGKRWEWAALLLNVLITLSTVFIKQHSVLDVFAGLALALATQVLVYRVDWAPTFNWLKNLAAKLDKRRTAGQGGL